MTKEVIQLGINDLENELTFCKESSLNYAPLLIEKEIERLKQLIHDAN